MRSKQIVVPVSTVKSVIYDDNQFLKFINKKDEFKNINMSGFVNAINKYVKYLIKTTQNLSKTIFKRVNYINEIFNVNLSYDYDIYLKSKKTIVSSKMLEDILNNEEILNKFMNYEDNKDYFQNIPLTEYLKTLDNIMNYYEKNGLSCSKIEYKHFELIMSKYSLLLKKPYILTGEKISESLDKSFEEYILKGVNTKDDKFTIARKIYLNLCKTLSYDINYFAFRKDLNNEVVQKLLKQPLSEINLENNRVICKPWATLYATLLNEMGIDATISSSFHKITVFNADGTIIKADATDSMLDENNFLLCDFARVQMNLGTAGFYCPEKHKNIKLDIEKADSNSNYHTLTKEEFIKNIKVEEDKLKMLSNLCKNNNMQDFELMVYIKLAIKLLLHDMIAWHVGLKETKDNFNPYLLINYNKKFYLLNRNDLTPITFSNLEKMFYHDEIRLLSSRSKIPGIPNKILRK